MPSVTTNGIEMHYEVQGEGQPVLCIMGITAPGAVWVDHVSFWSESFQCFTPDNRGVGLTDKPAGAYSTAMMADDFAGFIEALDLGAVHVVGCSMGSVIAQELALRHPEKVKSLVLMCSWARCDAFAKSTFALLQQLKAHARPEVFVEYIQQLIFHKRSWDDPEFYQTMLEGRIAAGAEEHPQPLHGLEGQAAACVGHDSFDRLKSIQVPTLVIGGEDDVFTPRWMAEEIVGEVPQSELHLYPESGHAFHWENIEDFNPRVRDFLQAQS